MANTSKRGGSGSGSGRGGRNYTPAAQRRAAAATGKSKAKPRRQSGKRRTRKQHAARRGPIGLLARLFGWIFALIWRLVWRGAVVVALISGVTIYYFSTTLPPADALMDSRTAGSVTLMDRHGEVFAWRGKQFGGQIDAATVSPMLKNAVIATEDKRFYRHFGVSPRGIASAVRINLREGRGPLSGHGGSTITQQVAKLICMGVPYDPDVWENETAYEADCRRSSMWRKLKEMHYAVAMELAYSKDQILSIYLNRAFLGAGAHGFEAAAQRYFGRSANDVNAPQAAMLAGLLVAPTRYAPTGNLARSQERAATVLKLMHEQGFISDADRAAAAAAPATLSAAAEARAGGYFADWLMERGPGFLTRDTTEDVVVRTTFDARIQQAAEEGLQAVLDAKLREGSQAQAAIVIMSADGAVRAMVGGRKFRGVAGSFNRAVMAKRQTGSAFKPFVYATALDLGWRFDDIVEDAPLTLNIPGSGPWSPKNYTGDFRGRMTLTDALVDSVNTPAVRISELVGRDLVRTVAEAFGIKSELAVGRALALGTSESSLLEMTGAYAGILNGGSSVQPYGLIELRMLGEDTPLMTQVGGMGERVIANTAAQQLIYMMHQVVERGTGQRAKLPGWQVAGKTGTTNSARDAWFLGFSADYVAGVWMGYDDNTPLSGVTGGGLPAEIWQEVMARVHGGLTPRALPMITPAQMPRAVPQSVDTQQPPPQATPEQRRGTAIENVLNTIFGTSRP
jgi:membrane peptidoglycan carboxypeptidase